MPSVLRSLGWTWGARGGTVDLAEVRCGPYGMVGLRDPHLVQNADGTPVTDGGDVFVTWTCAGLGFFGQAHWGVFRLDPTRPDRMHQVAHLYTRRDGLLLGDHAGQLVRDGDRWLVVTSSWGDFSFDGVHVRQCVTDADLLEGIHVLSTERVDLPTTLSAWDPGMTRIEGAWVFTFVESPSQRPFVFHPAVARTAAALPWEGLARAGSADQLTQTEGPVLVHGPAWRILASDGEARTYRVFDLDLVEVGRLDAPYGTNIPHPQLVPLADGGWLMTTFDDTDPRRPVLGYGGHGDVVVLRAGSG